MPQALIRTAVEKLPFVSRTWIEWAISLTERESTLVIEVTIDTDPNIENVRSYLDDLHEALDGGLRKSTTVFNHVRVVPRDVYNDRVAAAAEQ